MSIPNAQTYHYQRHEPEKTTLYKLIQANWLPFQQQVERDLGYPLPDFVNKEFEAYLRCGILAHGFLRAQCASCHHEMLVAFSCKKRGFCPSCGARRMSETAAHLVDHVLPHKNIRQWVLTFPVPIRLCLAVRPKVMGRALEIAHLVIGQYYRNKAGLGATNAKAGAVTLIQRFGGSLNLNIHFHQLFVDGCYELNDKGEPIDFWVATAPTVKEIEEVLTKIIHKLTKYLERQKIIIKDDNDGGFQIPIPDEDTLSKLQATSVTYRFATGKSKGKKAIVLKSVTDTDHSALMGLVAKNSGFSMHAGVATFAHERDKLEKICRYIARPAVAEERLSTDDFGNVIYRFKKPWGDGTTALKLTPMELMERLVALVPRPRVHLTRYHGVLGPHYKHRKQIVPKPPELKVIGQDQDNIDPKQLELKKKNIPWARLLARVFNIDVETCIKCGGNMKIIAAIEDPKVIRKILEHMGLETKPPPLHPARGPPKVHHHFEDDFNQQHFEMNFDNFNQSAD
jgi:hypothetical protein